MKKHWKRVWIGLLGIFFLVTLLILRPLSVYATGCPDGAVPTAILGNGGCSYDDGQGSGITDLLGTILQVLSVGIGVFAIVGIVVVGIQYLTAADSPEQVKKAKRRLFEIVLGVVAYALLYALLVWLLPSFGD